MRKVLFFSIYIILCCFSSSCKKENTVGSSNKKAVELFNTQCAVCHKAPSPKDLPKDLWKNAVLPEMGARMGIYNPEYKPLNGLSFEEQKQIIKSGIYPKKPAISNEDWLLIKEYIIESAPDSLDLIKKTPIIKGLNQFKTKNINLDSIPGSSICFLKIDDIDGNIITANITGKLSNYNYKKGLSYNKGNFESPVISYIKKDSIDYITSIGILNPSELSRGKTYKILKDSTHQIIKDLHRPVYSSIYDFNKDGKDEILLSEFGYLTGMLSLWKETDTNIYEKSILMNQPGVIRTIIKDMNNDGKMDIVAMSTQGNEGISILYQTKSLSFTMDQVIRFNPVYGSSWFELVDYDGDGDQDIITVNGDNADKTYVAKPYHGMRIYINDGENNFEEKYFYPMYGATRIVANDFDGDNDLDFALLSSFPNYEESPDLSFVYLENKNSKIFKFDSYSLNDPSIGRWLLLDAGDIDKDGDIDIVLSSFSYYFTPVPKDLNKKWKKSNTDILILENKHIDIK